MKLEAVAVACVLAFSLNGAHAAVVAGSEVCGELPNTKWSWDIQTQTVVTGGEQTESTTSATKVAGNNTFLIETTTTTTLPTFSTTNTICNALNPQGKLNLDHSTSIVGEPVQISDGSSTSSSTQVKVCGPNLTPC